MMLRRTWRTLLAAELMILAQRVSTRAVGYFAMRAAVQQGWIPGPSAKASVRALYVALSEEIEAEAAAPPA